MKDSQKTKKEKNIERWMQEHNLSREEAEKLTIYGQDEYLTVEQLRIKYDYPELGKSYPDWLTKEQHIEYCMKIARSKWRTGSFNKKYETYYDLGIDLFIKTSNRLNRMSNEKVLVSALVNACRNIQKLEIVHNTIKKREKDMTEEELEIMKDKPQWDTYRISAGSRWAMSLDAPVLNTANGETGTTTYGNLMPDPNEEKHISDNEFLSLIKNVKPKEVKYLFVFTGYIIAGLDFLEEEFIDITRKLDKNKAKQLIDLKVRQQCYEAEVDGMIHSFSDKLTRTKKVSLKDIVEVMGNEFYLKICPSKDETKLNHKNIDNKIEITEDEENKNIKMNMRKLLKELSYYMSESGIVEYNIIK